MKVVRLAAACDAGAVVRPPGAADAVQQHTCPWFAVAERVDWVGEVVGIFLAA